ncbi:MAG TPA: hypothetical protein ACFCUY_11595 [Xenococcaceae cyanobacterium]
MKELYRYIKWLNYIFWERITTATMVQESSLGIFRWILGIFLLLFAIPHFGWISQAPKAFFDPPYLSIANLFNTFPGDLFFYSIDLLIIVSLLFLTLGIKAKLFNCILLISWLVGNNFRYSFGKIDHDIMLLALLFCMFFSNWGAYYALVPDKISPQNSAKKALALFSVILAFGMITAGFKKLINWVDFDFTTSGFLSWFYPGYYDLNRNQLLASSILEVPKWIFEFADYTAVIFELSALIILLSSLRKLWLLWLLVACLFHLSNTLLLNIAFVNYFVVYLAFVDFALIKEQLFRNNKFLSSNKIKYFFAGTTFSLFLAHFLRKLYGQGFTFVPGNGLYNSIVVWLLAAIIIGINLILITVKKSSVEPVKELNEVHR